MRIRCSRLHYFNPRSREGSDNYSLNINLTHSYFNPRSREGSDRTKRNCFCKYAISIHAPAKGATKLFCNHVFIIPFQSTLPRRERPVRFPFVFFGRKFQSTLPRRERQHLLTSFRLQYGYSLFHLTNKI